VKKTILEIYALAVCFVTVVCFVVSLGIGTYSLIQIMAPGFTQSSWEYNRHLTNDAYWDSQQNCGTAETRKKRPGEAELMKQREDSLVRAVAGERREGAQALVKSLIVMLIDVVVFLAHWFVARRARNVTAA
jgi:hypothetical protein